MLRSLLARLQPLASLQRSMRSRGLHNISNEHNGLVVCSLNHAPGNTLDISSLRLLDKALTTAAHSPSARLMVLESRLDGVFSLGLDGHHLLSLHTIAQRAELFDALLSLYRTMVALPIPIIANINGVAFAGGAVLALACDQRLFSSKASVSFSEVKVGLPLPTCIASELRNAVHGHNAFYDMAVLGRSFDAQAALRAGFASAVYQNQTECHALIQDHLGKVSRLSRQVVQATRLEYRRRLIAQIDHDLVFIKQSGNSYAQYFGDAYLGEGVRAYLENRPPVWKH